MIQTVLFDLDGTLLPMDQDEFVHEYFSLLARKLSGHGYEPQELIRSIWSGTKAMVQNDGTRTNEQAFWVDFCGRYGAAARNDEALFNDFYETEFPKVQAVCGYNHQAEAVVGWIREQGVQVVLATNPVFPAVATLQRIRWAGLQPEDFALITTYENASYCKPNPAYYQEIAEKLGLEPAKCLMVGNDVTEDTVAEKLGMKVFLLTDCLINKENRDLSAYPHGGFSELMGFLRENL